MRQKCHDYRYVLSLTHTHTHTRGQAVRYIRIQLRGKKINWSQFEVDLITASPRGEIKFKRSLGRPADTYTRRGRNFSIHLAGGFVCVFPFEETRDKLSISLCGARSLLPAFVPTRVSLVARTFRRLIFLKRSRSDRGRDRASREKIQAAARRERSRDKPREICSWQTVSRV